MTERAGGSAIATSSYAIADSLGYEDGENIPFSVLFEIVSKISKSITVPLSVDIEAGYGDAILENILQLLKIGVIGINLEDRVIGAQKCSLVDMRMQCNKIKAISDFTQSQGHDLFINARTDVFFMDQEHTVSTADNALERCKAYKDAGANGIFIPGLKNASLMSYFVKNSPLPVNIMYCEDSPSISDILNVGVERISYGPQSYFDANKDFEGRVKEMYHDHK